MGTRTPSEGGPPLVRLPAVPCLGSIRTESLSSPDQRRSRPSGGSVGGEPGLATSLGTINNPVIDWTFGGYDLGNDALSTPVASLHNQLEVEIGAEQRCGDDSLFGFILQTASNDRSYLRVIDGDDSEIAWEVDLGRLNW